MNDETANLHLPYIMAAQAQKHVTHNEAIRSLDAIVQLSVLDRDLAAPPVSPVDGQRFIIATGATGGWSGHDNEIAAFQDNAWMFYQQSEGWLAWVSDEDVLVAWDGLAWSVAGGGGSSMNPTALVGINTTADVTNKLAVKSDAVLFSHDDVTPGNGSIRHKLNKASVGDTASFLFQDNWSGRAEVGLTGNDFLKFKVSSDGMIWADAMTLKESGGIGFVGIGTDNPIRQFHLRNLTQAVVMKIEGPATGSTRFRIHRNGEAEASGFEFTTSGATYGAWVHNNVVHMSTDGAGRVTMRAGPFQLKSYTVATLPSAPSSGAGSSIFVSNETGGAVTAFSDGTNWRRTTDRAIIS